MSGPKLPAITPAEKLRARDRLAAENPIPLSTLSAFVKVPALALQRWGISGERGVRLDVTFDRRDGWMSSVAAVKRFRVERARAKKAAQATRRAVMPAAARVTRPG